MADGEAAFDRADLICHGVRHDGASFETRVFLNNPDADETTPQTPEQGFAGYFVIFGHGGCAGDEGHCEVPEHPDDPEDLRLPHPLHPATKPVVVTDAVRALAEPRFTVTAVPVLPGLEAPRRADVLFFDGLALLTYDP